VLEDQNLYDDLDKEQIDKIKKSGLIREINIEEKKHKPPIFVLFSKNYANDKVDEQKLEEKTSEFLKKHWTEVEKEIEVRKGKDFSNLEYLQRKQKIIGKKRDTGLKKKRKTREEEDVSAWKNHHLSEKIEKALKRLDELIEITNKNKTKRIKN